MLSAIITAALLVVMLLIVTSFILGARREQQRQRRLLSESNAKTTPLQPTTATLQLQPGIVLATGKTEALATITLPSSWYTRRRTFVSLGLIVMALLALFIQDSLAGGSLHNLSKSLGFTILGYSGQQQASNVQIVAHPLPSTASTRLVRVDSASSKEYYNNYQLNVWSYSSCSGIAMEMVMNAYGRHLIAADVLQVEANLGVWSVQLGLLREEGIALTANYFGFNADLSHQRTVQDIVAVANKGEPVIVGVRDSYYYPGGHIFVVRGGDSQYVYIADSSPANFQRMPYSMFSAMWQGFSAVLTPR